jgi:hypothetical protein
VDAAELSGVWSAGLSDVELLLAEDVVFEWWSGGVAPCRGRHQVAELLRAQVDPASGRLPALGFEDLAGGLVLGATAENQPAIAVMIHQHAGRIVRIVQYGSREHAIEHLDAPRPDEPADGFLPADHPLAEAAVAAIHSGNVDDLRRLLDEHPRLATVRLGHPHDMSRTLLHVVTDWPGHYPAGAQIVTLLVAAGADVNARFAGPHREAPLHWAASSDDVEVLDALLDAGADIEADGAVIAGGTALADATAFGQWNAARRLIDRGARTDLGQAASLGLLDRVHVHLAEDGPTPRDITSALWMACHGGQQSTAELLLDQGADLNWIGYDGLTPLDAAIRSEATELAGWLRRRGALSAAAVTTGQ